MYTDDDDDYVYETDLEKWNKNNDTGMSAGTCPNCGSKIYQSTFSDFCICGDNDHSY